ncbi:stress response membrane protein YncL [Enterococcus faecalis]
MNVSSRTVVLINVFAAVGLFTLISMRFGWFILCSDFARSTYCQRNQCSDSTQDLLILLRSAILSFMFNHDVADDGVILQPIK